MIEEILKIEKDRRKLETDTIQAERDKENEILRLRTERMNYIRDILLSELAKIENAEMLVITKNDTIYLNNTKHPNHHFLRIRYELSHEMIHSEYMASGCRFITFNGLNILCNIFFEDYSKCFDNENLKTLLQSIVQYLVNKDII